MSDFEMVRDVLVVGAGPAGLGAASEAARFGARVLVVDENQRPGGQLFKQIHKFFGSASHKAGKRGFDIGEDLLEEARDQGVEIWLDSILEGVLAEGAACVVQDQNSRHIPFQTLILATGAQENTVIFPGWTLPGVLTAGAAQTFANLYGILPGKNILMLGSGNVGIIVAYQLLQAGARLVGVVDINPEGKGYQVHLDKLRRAGVPFFLSHQITRAWGNYRVEGVELAEVDRDFNLRPGTAKKLEADTICLAVGLHPRTQLPLHLKCRLKYIPELGGWVTIHNEDMETTVNNIFIAGDAAGVEEANVALDEGRLAGVSAAQSLGLVTAKKAEVIKKEYRERLVSLRSGKDSERLEGKRTMLRAYYE